MDIPPDVRENAAGETTSSEQQPRAPSEAEIAALRELVRELICRAPPAGG